MRAFLAEVEPVPTLTRSGPGAVYSTQAAPRARTLLDILAQTAHRHPHAPALDDGVTLLSYRALETEIDGLRERLAETGIGVGDRVGVRLPSGTVDLYVSILAVLAAGAAYVPVDADDPDERAELVFAEADVSAVLGADRTLTPRRAPRREARAPGPDDDAWIIFTSGSTGRPKGVAVTHRSAAAFVDAEAGLFLSDEPMGPGDRVLAGLSVAFDASCEEMWLAWRHGACLVAAPRSLVRTGMDLGPWLVEQRITVVSTVPTLATLWPAEALDDVRLLIFGGEACPPELAERLAVEGREVWNTYGPTEATVVACAAQLTGEGPVRIGLPLDGWQLAVVDAVGQPVAMGEVGELVIGGVGLARYLDAAKDAEKFAPLPALGWSRAYRSGDLVRAEPEGLLFVGRGDEQVKLGGRRIELGEVDAALQALPGVVAAAAAVRTTGHGNQLLVGYVVPADDGFDKAAAVERLRVALPAALIPLIAVVDGLPTRTSGKVDRAALPWPLPDVETAGPALDGTEAWLAEGWAEILGLPPGGPDDDFFASGGSSLGAAQLVTLLRGRYPSASVSDVYQHPTLRALARRLDEFETAAAPTRTVLPTPRRTGLAQSVLMLPLLGVVGLRWVVALAALNNVLALFGSYPWAPTVSWWWVLLGALLVISPARPARDRGRRRPPAAARCAPGQPPARRRRPHATVGRRTARGVERRDQPRRRVDHLVRPRAGREDRPRRRPALAAAGHRDAPDRAGRRDRAGGRPVRPLGRRRRRAHRADPDRRRARRSAPAARCCPARGSASGPRSRRGRACSVRCRRRSAGPASRRTGPAGRPAAGRRHRPERAARLDPGIRVHLVRARFPPRDRRGARPARARLVPARRPHPPGRRSATR